MRAVGLGIGAWGLLLLLLLEGCSLVSLDGLAGSGGAASDGAAGPTDAGLDTASSGADAGGGLDATAQGDGPGLTDAPGPVDTGGGGVDAPSLPPYRVVFVTSQLYGGNLGGIQGADTKCQTLASKAGLPGTFFAWISAGAVTPAARMSHENLPYVLVDGHTQVAAGWSQLVNGTLDHPIDTTELNTQVTPTPSCGPQGYIGLFVWTDTDGSGSQWNQGDTCATWTSSAASITGSTGNATSVTYWTAWCVGVPCSTQAALYCVQQ